MAANATVRVELEQNLNLFQREVEDARSTEGFAHAAGDSACITKQRASEAHEAGELAFVAAAQRAAEACAAGESARLAAEEVRLLLAASVVTDGERRLCKKWTWERLPPNRKRLTRCSP